MNVPKMLLAVMTALLFVGLAHAASPVTLTPEIEFIVGPVHDPAKNPWPWFDKNGNERGLHIGSAFPVEPARMQIAWPYVGILETEHAYRERDLHTDRLPAWYSPRYRYTHNMFSLGHFVRTCLGWQGPAMVISTACSSSAKVFATAARLMQAGLCDAAVVGGVDSLCLTTLYGFSALQVVGGSVQALRRRSGRIVVG